MGDLDNTWVVHGEAYDLREFAAKHPGGRWALEAGRGRDCTAMFESYHCFSGKKPWKVLEAYKVERPEAVKKLRMYQWKREDPVYNDLKEAAKEALEKHGVKSHKASWTRWAWFWLASTLQLVPIYYFTQGHWWSIVVLPLFLWVYSVNFFHDGSHFAISHRPWINTLVAYAFPYFESPSTWLHQHVIGHHAYTNLDDLDPDIMDRMQKRKSIWKYSLLYWPLFTEMGCFVFDAAFLVTGKYKRKVPMSPAMRTPLAYALHIAARAATLFVMHILPFIWFDGIKAWAFAFVPVGIFGTCFAAMTQLSHMTMETYGSPKEASSWAQHEIQTSLNIATHSTFWRIFSGALSLQIEHHLFPGVCSEHLPILVPVVKELCKKHGITYNEAPTYMAALRSHIALLNTCNTPGFWA